MLVYTIYFSLVANEAIQLPVL